MDRNAVSGAAAKFRVILPVILRITFNLVLWTLGVTTMMIAEAKTGPMASTKQEESNPLLTRRAALTTPSGALFCGREDLLSTVRSCGQFREGW